MRIEKDGGITSSKGKTKEIEINNDDQARRRITVDIRCTVLNIPFVSKDGYGEIGFSAGGDYTEDGIEIWTPLKPTVNNQQSL